MSVHWWEWLRRKRWGWSLCQSPTQGPPLGGSRELPPEKEAGSTSGQLADLTMKAYELLLSSFLIILVGCEARWLADNGQIERAFEGVRRKKGWENALIASVSLSWCSFEPTTLAVSRWAFVSSRCWRPDSRGNGVGLRCLLPPPCSACLWSWGTQLGLGEKESQRYFPAFSFTHSKTIYRVSTRSQELCQALGIHWQSR